MRCVMRNHPPLSCLLTALSLMGLVLWPAAAAAVGDESLFSASGGAPPNILLLLGVYYIGGILKHTKALNAFVNASTNSYKRLVKGFEAPTLLAYSARNRSAGVRIPWLPDPKSRRIEVRFPDNCGNPYFMFAAMLMAGIDGIQNKIHPGDPMDKDFYDLAPEEEAELDTVCFSLDQAIEELHKDREFLLAGDVFNNDLIDGYIALKEEEITRLRMSTHPVEFELYYSL